MPLKFAKPTPTILVKGERRAQKEARERAEAKLVRLRSGGRCEVVTQTPKPECSELRVERCKAKAEHLHHLISGIGKRNVGASALSPALLHTCSYHHRLIHLRVIVPTNLDDRYNAAKVRYEVVR